METLFILFGGVIAGLVVYQICTTKFWKPQKEVEDRYARLNANDVNTLNVKKKSFDLETKFRGIIARFDKIMPATRSDKREYREKLVSAGLAIEPETWRGITVLCTIGLAAVFGLFAFGNVGMSAMMKVVAILVGGVVGYLFPRLYLHSKTKTRREAIENDLPDAINLLNISVSAGTTLDRAFRDVASCIGGPIGEEFGKVDNDVHLFGHSRDEALRDMEHRCKCDDMSALVASVAQASKQGSSVSDILAEQASQARKNQWAKAFARIKRAPTIISAVLGVCFLPATMVMLIAPFAFQLVEFFGQMLS